MNQVTNYNISARMADSKFKGLKMKITAHDGTVSQIVIEELPPLHQHQRPDFALARPVARFSQRLRHQTSAGQFGVAFCQPWRIDTCSIKAIDWARV